MNTKIPRNEGKGRKPGTFRRNKKASQYKERARRAFEAGDERDGRTEDVLYRNQLLNQARQSELKEPGVPLPSRAMVFAHLEDFEEALFPHALC